MTTAALLSRAEAAGVALHADGARLRLVAAEPPSPALLHELAGAKAELLALLERRADEAAERAAIQAEPDLPLFGSADRTAMACRQAPVVAGLLRASRVPSQERRNND